MPAKHSKICSEHFTEDQFDRTSLVCVRLRANAIPSIFKEYKHRKPSRSRQNLVNNNTSPRKRKQLIASGKMDEQGNLLAIEELNADFLEENNSRLITNGEEKEKERKHSLAELEVCQPCKEKWKEHKPSSLAELEITQRHDINNLELCEDRKPCLANLEASLSNQEECEDKKPPLSELEFSLSSQLHVQKAMPPPDETPAYILPESDLPRSLDEPYDDYIEPKLEPSCSPDEVCTISDDLECDSFFNPNEPSTEYVQLKIEEVCTGAVEFDQSESSVPFDLNTENNREMKNDPNYSSSVEKDHMYSNSVNPKLLKQKIDFVCNHLVLANRKLKTERQRNRRAKETISRLVGIIFNLQMKSLLH